MAVAVDHEYSQAAESYDFWSNLVLVNISLGSISTSNFSRRVGYTVEKPSRWMQAIYVDGVQTPSTNAIARSVGMRNAGAIGLQRRL